MKGKTPLPCIWITNSLAMPEAVAAIAIANWRTIQPIALARCGNVNQNGCRF
jgi:hypothetical protein